MASLDDLVTFLKSGVTALNRLTQVMQGFFPQQTGTSATATGGAATLPANPVGFITVTLQNGTAVKVPYYNS